MAIIPPVFSWMMHDEDSDEEIQESMRNIKKSSNGIDESIKGLADVQNSLYEKGLQLATQHDALFEENQALKAELAETIQFNFLAGICLTSSSHFCILYS